jgi:protein-S-isoprenylcysteine O-methyltransferase Ste14
MQPYYQTHAIGALYLLVLLTWYGMEIIEWLRQRQWRKDAARIGPRSYWPALWACAVVAVTMLFLAPHIASAAEIGDGGAAFAVGMVILVAGVALRAWSFLTLGRYFTFTVKVSPDQPVVTAGPYRVLRHPGYAGGMLGMIGVGLIWGNWLTLATVTVLWLALIVWRIRTEEKALLAALDDRYRAYAAHHKRLVPLVW